MSKPPTLTYHERARVAARARWGPPRVVNLGDCDPRLRRLLLAMIEAARSVELRDEDAA